jgi:hypothetical protein
MAGTTLDAAVSGNICSVTVPSVDVHEVIAIDF